jgi:ribosome biogenesis GTPase / thiamine phosphate phosphatase
MTLAQLGWNDQLAQAFASHAAAGWQPARVTLELKGHLEVTGEFGAGLGQCTGKYMNGALTPAEFPAIGDWVAVSPQPGDAHRQHIHALLPRRTKFSRKTAGEEELEQIVAANIDTVFIVSSFDGNYHLHRVERYLAATWASGAQPVILLNKADLTDDTDAVPRELAAAAPGVPIHVVSAQTRRGLKALAPYLQPGRTVALLGSSGVGKSTLINRLVGDNLQFTQEVRESDRKGRHTTTQRELLVAPEGFIVIDTPGMREIQPWFAEESVRTAFADILALTTRCKFRDCSHSVEPGCAVQAAVAAGKLNVSRWHSCQRMLSATVKAPTYGDRRAAEEKKRGVKKATKLLRRRVAEKTGED